MENFYKTENICLSDLFEEKTYDVVTLESVDLNSNMGKNDKEKPNCCEISGTGIGSEQYKERNYEAVDFNSCLDTTEADVVIDKVRSVTIRAALRIEGVDIYSVVDTGAEVTVMSDSMFY